MIIKKLTAVCLTALFVAGITLSTSWAGRDYRSASRFDDRRPAARHVEKGYVLDKRHRHNHYYPPSGRLINKLPDRNRKVVHHGTRYYLSSGSWYRPSGAYFSVVAPPIGIVVPVLPRYYTTVWFSDVPYYYAGGTYYRWSPQERGYRVSSPPEDTDLYEEPEVPDQLFVYPRAGQDEKLLATDRYECHRWAANQSGFDPTQPGGNVSVEENSEKRVEYNRATKACLEAREYSVQ